MKIHKKFIFIFFIIFSIKSANQEDAVDSKFVVDERQVKGKAVVLVDDSLVKGNTMRRLARKLRAAGAREIHLRIASPKIIDSCYYGVDHKRHQLAARGHDSSVRSDDEISRMVGVESLIYLSLPDMHRIAEESRGRQIGLCDACFSGLYPIPIDENLMLDKKR